MLKPYGYGRNVNTIVVDSIPIRSNEIKYFHFLGIGFRHSTQYLENSVGNWERKCLDGNRQYFDLTAGFIVEQLKNLLQSVLVKKTRVSLCHVI